MKNADLIELIKWTMTNYGSPAGEAAVPGSRLQSQAEYIAEVVTEYGEASARCGDLTHVMVIPYWPGREA